MIVLTSRVVEMLAEEHLSLFAMNEAPPFWRLGCALCGWGGEHSPQGRPAWEGPTQGGHTAELARELVLTFKGPSASLTLHKPAASVGPQAGQGGLTETGRPEVPPPSLGIQPLEVVVAVTSLTCLGWEILLPPPVPRVPPPRLPCVAWRSREGSPFGP